MPSDAMLPTLRVGDVIEADLDAYESAEPKRGDVVIFHPPAPANGEKAGLGPSGQCGVDDGGQSVCSKAYPQQSAVKFVKRVVAGPGDTVAMVDGHLILNGKRQEESFIRLCGSGADCTFGRPITIAPGYWFMLGDNRGESDDSRFWGPVPQAWIVAKVTSTS